MPILDRDELIFRFPDHEEHASFGIAFQRTLRIPDTDTLYSLPPGLGCFPVRHVEDHQGLPAETRARGGVILPIWQAEAMWLAFDNSGPRPRVPFPVAIKVAAGKINAVTGEAWHAGLHRPQDYLYSPDQPWLDGFAVEKGVVRQFVAMRLGEGYSAEEQVTGGAEWGGLQISVTPLRKKVWLAWRDARLAEEREVFHRAFSEERVGRVMPSMGLAPGGRMRQHIYPDPFDLADWDQDATQRVFVTLIDALAWAKVTGEKPPQAPPTAKEYALAGLPWFDWYGADAAALAGSGILAKLKSVAATFTEKTGATLPHSGDVATGPAVALGPKSPRPVTTAWAGD